MAHSFNDCNSLQYKILLSLIILFSFTSLQAQTNEQLTQTIKGYILDQASEEAIIGANIIVIGSDPLLGTSTDIDGFFKIENVPVGRHSLQITSIGYQDAYVNELELGSAKEMILNLQLQESLETLANVEVVGKRLTGSPENDMATVSSRSLV